ncbi:MAG: hypothetical protein IKR45_05720 [Treponema sp.]|nr:hypothetical protein [Treponema sp.]
MPKKHVLCFLTVLLVLLSSCENFMKGSGVKDELSKLVEEANAPEVELYIACDPKYGVVAPSGYVSYKTGQSFNLVFIENPGYKFVRWQVQDKTSLQNVPNALSFEDANSKETKVKLLSYTKNLYISPECIELPKIESFYPAELDGGIFANTPVRIKFNMPITLYDDALDQMESEQIIKIIQTYPLHDGEFTDITRYYNAPVLSDDGTTILVTPKAQELSAYIQTQNAESLIRVKVAFNSGINALVNGTSLYRYVPDATNDSFYFRINSYVEDKPPEQLYFLATRDAVFYDDAAQDITIDISTLKTIPAGFVEGNALSAISEQNVYDRMAGEYLYFYGEYKDPDSGFDTILVEEKYVNTKEGIPAPDKDWIKGDVSAIQKWDTPLGTTRFILKYKIKSDDGVINFRITPSDFCGNHSQAQTFTIFKSTHIGLENVEPFNWLGNESDDENIYNWCILEEGWSDIPSADILKTVRISYDCLSEGTEEVKGYTKYLQGHELRESIFKNICLPPHYYSVSYKIGDKDYVPFDFHATEETFDTIKVASWIKTFDVDSIEGLCFKILVQDILGNIEEREYQFPGLAKIACVNDGMDPYLFYVSSDYPFDSLLTIDSNDFSHEQFDDNYFADIFGLVICKNKNLIGPIRTLDIDDLLLGSPIEADFSIQSIYLESAGEGTGKHNIIVNLSNNAWKISNTQTYDYLFIRYSTSQCTYEGTQMDVWTIKEFEKNNNTCTFLVNTEELYENGLNVVVWGKKGNELSEEVIYSDTNMFLHSNSVKDNSAPLFVDMDRTMDNLELVFSSWDESLNYRYEEYFIHPEIKEFISGLDYIEWWTDEVPELKYKAGQEYNWKEFVLPNWDLDSPKGNIHIKAVDKKNNSSECVFPYVFYDNMFAFEVMGTTGEDRRKFCMPNEIKECRNYELIISREDDLSQVPCKLAYNIKENASHYFSIRPYSTDYVINLSESLLEEKFDELNEDDFYINILDSLVKVTFTASLPDYSIINNTENYGVSNAVYMYCGDITDFSSKIVFLENGAMLSSNYPAIVYTLVTKQPYEECKDWDIQKWDRRRKQIGKEYFDFSGSVSTDIYEIPLDQISPGECYIMVAHFSDGSIKYSSVRQK